VRNGDGSRTYASGVKHLPQGPVTALGFGNGLTLSSTYDLRHEPLGVTSGPVTLTYVPSASGDVSATVDGASGVGRTFRYDFLDRLVESPGWLAYGYDGAGNRRSETVGNAGATFTYDYDRVKGRYPGALLEHAFGYDAQSNLSTIIRYDEAGRPWRGAVCLRHDLLRRLTLFGGTRGTAIYVPGGTGCMTDADVQTPVARFRYDARNRRVARQEVATGVTRYTVFDPSGNPLAELMQPTTAGGAWTRSREYVWLDGWPLAQLEHPGPGGGAAGYAYYVHADAIGLPRALTNEAGRVVWSASTRPYGDLVETTTPDPQNGRTVVTNLRLPGQYDERLLGSVGLQGPYYNWNRWYLPGVGRYLEPDPIAMMGGMNGGYGPDWYGYGSQNPLTHFDPDGRLDPGTGRIIIIIVEGGTSLATFVGGGVLGVIIPTPTGVDPCENSPGGCVGPRPQPQPNDCSPKAGTCKCTCLGVADPNWNPEDESHGERDVGQQGNKAECRAECKFRGFDNYQCI